MLLGTSSSCLVPAGAIAVQPGDRAWGDLCADLLKVQVHTLVLAAGAMIAARAGQVAPKM
jgi:hypothetical protein